MKKRVLSLFLSTILFILVTCPAMADSSPYGYLTKEEIAVLENNANVSNDSGTYYSKDTLSEDQAYDLIGQMQKLFGQGLYIEASQLASDTLNNYIVPDAPKELIELIRQCSDFMYQQYLLKIQRFTFRMPGWGMNITCRVDMIVTNNENNIWLYPLDDESRFFCVDSSKIGDEMYVNYGYIKIKNSKQYVDAQISDIKRLYTRQLEYGGKFDILSANYINASGFTAYQVVYRNTVYTNRYWTEGSHLMGKMIAFQYGQWIYSVWAEESAYNWSDDFWDAMEVVINGISFS